MNLQSILFLLLLLLMLVLPAQASTNTGSLYFDSCTARWYLRWTNPPPAMVLQESNDLTNWTDIYLFSRPPGLPASFPPLQHFDFPIASTNRVLFFRLRQIDQVPCPPSSMLFSPPNEMQLVSVRLQDILADFINLPKSPVLRVASGDRASAPLFSLFPPVKTLCEPDVPALFSLFSPVKLFSPHA